MKMVALCAFLLVIPAKDLKMAKDTEQLFEDGYVSIATGMFRLRQEGKHQEAYDEIGHILSLLMEMRQDIRKTAEINL